MLTKLRRDIASYLQLLIKKIAVMMFNSLVILAFLEFFYAIRFVVFLTSTGLLAPVYDSSLFNGICKKEGEPILNPIALIVIVITDNYINKMALNPGSGTWTKKRDELPVWLKLSAVLIELVEPHTTADLIKN